MTHEATVQHEEPYVPYDYDEDRGFSPLGAEALMGEQMALDTAERLPAKLGAFAKAYVEHDPSKTETEVTKTFSSQVRKMSPDDAPDLFRLEMEARTEAVGHRLGTEKMTKTLAETREQLGGLDVYDRAKIESSFTRALTDDDEKSVFGHFSRWKEASGKLQDSSWTEWLAAKPDEGGATDEQLRNVLQWNEYKYQKTNQEEAEHIRLHEWAFGEGLEQAVKAGQLDQALLDNFKNQPKPNVTVADPLSLQTLGAHGYILQDKYAGHVSGRSIVLEEGWRSRTFVHERMHILGRFTADRDLNEATTDKLALKIFNESPLAELDSYDPSYQPEITILDSFMFSAGMDDQELSRLYANRDSRTFIERLDTGAETGDIFSHMENLEKIAEHVNRAAGNPTDRASINRTIAILVGSNARQHLRP